MPSAISLIKGYLPVRLCLPEKTKGGGQDETFFFVREHKAGKSGDDDVKSGTTIFVANAPVVPGIGTRLLLQSLLGRYGDVKKVVVVENPRQVGAATDPQDLSLSSSSSSSWSKFKHPSFLAPIHSEGKFAHVVFQTPKDMRKALKSLSDIMRQSRNSTNSDLPGLELESIEIQTLSDETKRQYQVQQNNVIGLSSEEDGFEDEGNLKLDEEKTQRGILKVAERYRETCSALSREKLLEECNAVMQTYEDAEEASRRAKEAAKTQTDEDGFITVTYSTAVESKSDLEESTIGTSRRRGNKRSRKRKQSTGASELQDFYRFQRKENRKRSLEDLRKQFDEDLKKVKRLKDERQYRPF